MGAFNYHSISGTNCPVGPSGNLTVIGTHPDVRLYGTSELGGLYGTSKQGGTLFCIDGKLSPGSFQTLVNFYSNATEMAYYVRHGSLVVNGSLLYGVTTFGGAHQNGILYSYNPALDTVKVLFSFTGKTGPGSSHSNPILVNGTTFYGLSQEGGQQLTKGSKEYMGTLYSIDISSPTKPIVLYEFDGPHGARPHSTPTYVSGNATNKSDCLYGMTRIGGPGFDPDAPAPGGLGVIFEFDLTESTYSVVYSFEGGHHDGATPYHNDFLLVSGTLYGMTHSGGHGSSGQPDTGHGVVFSLVPGETKPTIMHRFSGTDGSKPLGSLIQDPRQHHSATLYGVTAHGGEDNKGTMFSIQTDGTAYTVLHSFLGTDGEKPADSLVWHKNTLYGLTQAGGASKNGVVFSYSMT